MEYAIGLGVALSFLILLAALIYAAGTFNILITFVGENEAEIITENEKFYKAIMSSDMFAFEHEVKQHSLRGYFVEPDFEIKPEDRKGADKWNIWTLHEDEERPIHSAPFGIYWVGIPPYREVHTYKQVETHYVQTGSDEGVKMKEVTKTENYDHIPLQDMTLVLVVEEAETNENVPVTLKCSITIRIVNPYKYAFAVEETLNTLFDQLGPEIRTLVGVYNYEDLNDRHTSTEKINRYIRGELEEIANGNHTEDYFYRWVVDYGVAVIRVQVQTVEPASELAESFIRASTEQYVKKQEAEAEAKRIRITADARAYEIEVIAKAEKDRIEMVYAVIEATRNGETIRLAEALENTNVSYVSFGSSLPLALPANDPQDKPKSNTGD